MRTVISGTLEFPYRYGSETVLYKVKLGLGDGHVTATILDPEGQLIAQQSDFGSLSAATSWAREQLGHYWEAQEGARKLTLSAHECTLLRRIIEDQLADDRNDTEAEAGEDDARVLAELLERLA